MRDLTQGPIVGHLLGMAMFIGISLNFQTMYFIVDLYFVSRLGSAVIAGVSASGNVFFLALAASQLISIGVMATVAQAVGKKDEAMAVRAESEKERKATMEEVIAQVQSDRLDQAKLARLFEQHQAGQTRLMQRVLPKLAEWHATLRPEQKAEAVEHLRKWMDRYGDH